MLGSNRDLVKRQVPFAFHHVRSYPQGLCSYAWEGLERSGPFPILSELHIHRLWAIALDMIVVRSILMRGHT